MTKTYKPDVCLYHASCADGMAAAWAVWERWGDAVRYVPVQYGDADFPEGVEDARVLIVDFSYKRDDMIQLMLMAKDVVVLDHHKTAQEELRPYIVEGGVVPADEIAHLIEDRRDEPGGMSCLAFFDMEKSGARLAWEFCFPGMNVPALIGYVEDRDLWRFRHGDATRNVAHYLKTREWSLSAFAAFNREFETDLGGVLTTARVLRRFFDRQVAAIVETATVMDFCGHSGVPVVHCPYDFVSDACHALLERNPAAPFAAAVVGAHGGKTCSLRSSDDRMDVSEIAKARGGGGHRNAAGFRMGEDW